MAGLSPQQLQIVSQEYYTNGFVLGRDKLYEHLQVNMNPMLDALNQFDSRDQIADWLKRQPVNTIHSRQRKPKNIDHFHPRYPLHSLSIDLIDYSKNGSTLLNPATNLWETSFYILVIIDNYSRFMWVVPMPNKQSATTANAFWNWYNTQYTAITVLPPVFVQMDNGGEFIMIDAICTGLIGCTVVRSIPNVPQSNSLVERSIGSLKRFLAKIIHIRHQGFFAITNNSVHGIPNSIDHPVVWQSWTMDLAKAVNKYNNTIHGAFKQTPYDAFNLNIVTPQQYFAGIPAQRARANQHPLPLNSLVRLIRHKGRLGKHDKNNFTPEVYIIINRRNENNQNLRTKYEIQLAHPNQVTHAGQVHPNHNPLQHWFYSEHLNEILL